MSLKIIITRSHLSYSYLRDPAKPPDWGNNDSNNSLDSFVLYLDDGIAGHPHVPIFDCRAQTVSNLEGLSAGSQSVDAHYYDTLAPGLFQLRAFVDPHQFWCAPHGICFARTLRGDSINGNSVTPTNPDRWLMHDWRKLKPNADGQDTRMAWSAGCIVVSDPALIRFGDVLNQQGVTAGDLIDGEIVMEA